MAVDFSSEATQVSPVQNYVTPKEGVVDKSTSVLLGGVSDVFESAGKLLEGRKASKQAGIIAEFASKQLMIADALEQGSIGSSIQARALARKNLLEAISANPTLAKDLIAADGSLTSLPGGTGVISEDTDEEKRWEAERTRLVSEGLVSPSATENEFQTAAEQRRVAAEASRRHEERVKTLDLQLKSNTLSTSERTRLEAERKTETNRYIQDMVPAEQQRVKTQFDTILNDPALSESDKTIAMEDFYNSWLAETSGLLGAADAQQASYMLKPFEALRDAYLKRATGEIGDEELKRQNTRAVELQRAFILADPDLARAAAASAIFGDSTVIQMFTQGNTVTNTKLMEMLRGGSASDPAHGASTPFVGIPEERKAVQGYLQGVTNSLNSADPEVKEEAKTQMTSLIASLEDYEGLIRSDPKKAIEVVNWLGSASFLAARNANPELFEDLSGPTDVLTRHYADEVWGLVQREFTNGKVLINTDINAPITGDMIASGQLSTDTSSLVQTRTTAGGVEFVAIDTENPDAVNAARRLNKELRPVINNTVKAFAHLEGRTDYGAVWDEVAKDVLGAGPNATTSGGDEGDDLSLNSFNTGDGALQQAMATGGYVGSGDYTEATTPLEVAASFVGFTETEHKDVISSFIKNAVGMDINPADTAWCAAFINGALGAKGVKGTDKLNARSFLNWGEEVVEPSKGDVVVFSRGNPSGWQGHVGFYVGPSEREGYIRVLGGNQGNKVSIKDYPTNQLLGYRRAV